MEPPAVYPIHSIAGYKRRCKTEWGNRNGPVQGICGGKKLRRLRRGAVRVLTGVLPSYPVNPEVLSQKIITMDRKNRDHGEDAILQKLSN
jgi:hypothetical protein